MSEGGGVRQKQRGRVGAFAEACGMGLGSGQWGLHAVSTGAALEEGGQQTLRKLGPRTF